MKTGGGNSSFLASENPRACDLHCLTSQRNSRSAGSTLSAGQLLQQGGLFSHRAGWRQCTGVSWSHSQNGWGWQGLLETACPSPCAGQRHRKQVSQGCALRISPRTETPQPPWATSSGVQSVKVELRREWEETGALCARCLLIEMYEYRVKISCLWGMEKWRFWLQHGHWRKCTILEMQ